MKEIEDIVRLYENMNEYTNYDNPFIYFQSAGYDHRYILKYQYDLESPLLWDAMKQVTNLRYRLERPIDFIPMAYWDIHDKKWSTKFEHLFTVRYKLREYLDVYKDFTIKITKEDATSIIKNNITTIEEYKRYKASRIIKDQGSTMMDVLCAFGDL